MAAPSLKRIDNRFHLGVANFQSVETSAHASALACALFADGGGRGAQRRRRVDAIGDALQPLPAVIRRHCGRGDGEASEGGIVEGERHAPIVARTRSNP
jgi:hypothetical protein